jgi:hypothetical protein
VEGRHMTKLAMLTILVYTWKGQAKCNTDDESKKSHGESRRF